MNPTDSRSSRQRPGGRRAVVAATAATLCASLPVYLVGALAVQIRHSLHFGPSTLGLVAGLYFVAAAASSVPLSRVSERVGGATVLRLGALLEGLVLVALGLGSRDVASLAALLVVAGVVAGWISPASYLFLARSVRPGRQGRAFGVNQAAVPLAPLLGGLAVPIIALSVGWRWAFVLAGALGVLASRLVPDAGPERPVRAWRRQREAADRSSLRLAPLVLLSVALGLGMFEASGLVTFLSSGAVALHLGAGTAGYLVAGCSLGAVLVRLALGALVDRRPGDHFGVVATIMAIGALAIGALAAVASQGLADAWALAAVPAVAIGWGWNAVFNYAVVRSHPDAPARATGVTDVGARLGGMLGPVVTGVVIARLSYPAGWLVLAAVAALAASMVVAGRALLARTPTPSTWPTTTDCPTTARPAASSGAP
ncbi:MFS transporter [Aciditerrimonas ferrireducens]|nr:MFS transporter [Aciditerrimonas ferrireducens]